MKNHIKFNTGRPYGLAGQRIAAIRWSKETVYFVDVDRDIDAFVACNSDTPSQAVIMEAYDNNRYDLSPLDPSPENHDRQQMLRECLTKFAKGEIDTIDNGLGYEDPHNTAPCLDVLDETDIEAVLRGMLIGMVSKSYAYSEIQRGHIGFERSWFDHELEPNICRWIATAMEYEYREVAWPANVQARPELRMLAWLRGYGTFVFSETGQALRARPNDVVFVMRKLLDNGTFYERVKVRIEAENRQREADQRLEAATDAICDKFLGERLPGIRVVATHPRGAEVLLVAEETKITRNAIHLSVKHHLEGYIITLFADHNFTGGPAVLTRLQENWDRGLNESGLVADEDLLDEEAEAAVERVSKWMEVEA